MDHVKIVAPNGNGTINCHPGKLDEMLAKGWTLAEDEPKPEGRRSRKSKPKGENVTNGDD